MARFSGKIAVAHQFFGLLGIIVIFSGYNLVYTEVIQHHSCSHIPSNSCSIINVTVTPCPEALDNEPCNFYRGTNSTLTIYYLPKFSAKTLTVQRYSTVLFVDVPDPYTDREACKFTPCPLTAGKVHVFNTTFPVLDAFPAGAYATKWKLWNEFNEECCFTTPVIIV